ncbi:S41 family peptidase [Deinococcus radiophilus]|uniref:S41 family peptidase n=1 Tax=Deinococcus radiophilus TaxID=32062 RepID=UPI001E3CA1A8|nr:S41 family peptidase [Deinococcus radiophilus]UFA51661.1 PDZ domain-containing protein [Deinococcus radiophilus]
MKIVFSARQKGWSRTLVLSALLVLCPLASAASGTAEGADTELVTAQGLFDEVIYELALNYNGPSQLRAQELRERFLPQLRRVCAAETVCHSEAAYGLVNQMLLALEDDHTYFLTPQEMDYMSALTVGGDTTRSFGMWWRRLEGWGAVITEVLPGTPADLAGLRPGDLMTHLGQLPLDGEWGMAKLFAAARSARTAELTFERHGRVRTASLAGTLVETPPVSLDMLDDRTALIRLRTFDSIGVAQDVHNTLRRAELLGATRAVLDLRGNPGGLVTETMLATGALTQPAPLREVTRISTELYSYDRGRYLTGGQAETGTGTRVFKPQRFTGPLAVLVDTDSASGAEFMTRDLLVRPETVVLGETTAGLADTSSHLILLDDGSALWVTAAQIQSQSGQVLGSRVQPDVPAPRDDAAWVRTGEDPQLAAALRELGKLR